MELMKLDIQMFGTVVKELFPAWVEANSAFRPYGIISYEQNIPNNTTTYRMELWGQLLDGYQNVNAVQYSFVTNVFGNTQTHTGQIDTTYVSSGQRVYLGYQEGVAAHQTNGVANQQVFQIGGSANLYYTNVYNPSQQYWGGWVYQGASEVWYHTAPTIPRVSSVTSNASTAATKKEFGTQVDFTISRYDTSFTHTLDFVCGGSTCTIGTGLATSASFVFPTDQISNYTNTADPTITVTCRTFSGTTLIGTSTTTVYLTVPTSYVPTCSLAISDLNTITTGWGIWVKSKSELQGVITGTGIAGSTISGYHSTFDGNTFGTSTFSRKISTAGELTVSSTVTDSRTRTATDTEIITVVDYTVPTITRAEVKRCLADGTLDEDGTYGKVVCTYSISPCNNNNTKQLNVRIFGGSTTFTLSAYSGTFTASNSQLLSGFDTTSSYNFGFDLIDAFETITQAVTMTPSFNLVSYFHGGKGLTFGRVATEEGFNCYLDATFFGELKKDISGTEHKVLGTNDIVQTATTDTDKVMSANGVKEKVEGTVLYNNATGTNGNVTLSETSANFDYLEIFYKDQDNLFNSCKIYNPNGKYFTMNSAGIGTGTIAFRTKAMSISGSSITYLNGYTQIFSNGASSGYNNSYIYIYITRVVGYK